MRFECKSVVPWLWLVEKGSGSGGVEILGQANISSEAAPSVNDSVLSVHSYVLCFN